MAAKQIRMLMMGAIVVGVLLLLLRHFQAMESTPLPDTQGLLGD